MSEKDLSVSSQAPRKINFGADTQSTLENIVEIHNSKVPTSRVTSLQTVEVVYRRGASNFSPMNRSGNTRQTQALARVNAFLYLLKSGSPLNSRYTADNDLLTSPHPLAIVASADYNSELYLSIKPKDEYKNPEDVILACAEYSGYGYESETAMRASWLRAVRAKEDPYTRVTLLASFGQNSLDADLLPKQETGAML